LSRVSPVQYSPKMAVQMGASRLWWKRLEWNSECVVEGESGEQVAGELQSVTLSAGCFVQGWRNETGSWFQRWGDA